MSLRLYGLDYMCAAGSNLRGFSLSSIKNNDTNSDHTHTLKQDELKSIHHHHRSTSSPHQRSQVPTTLHSLNFSFPAKPTTIKMGRISALTGGPCTLQKSHGRVSALTGGPCTLQKSHGRISALTGGPCALQGRISALTGGPCSIQGRISALTGGPCTLQGRISALTGGPCTIQRNE